MVFFKKTGSTSGGSVHPSLACDSFRTSPTTFPYITAGFGHGLVPVTVPAYNFEGDIDDMAIYGRALTPCEITQLYDTAIVSLVITGTTTVCAGSATKLSSSISGGTWSSGNTAVATADTNGVITGVSGGITTINYSLGSGCTATTTITVSTFPL